MRSHLPPRKPLSKTGPCFHAPAPGTAKILFGDNLDALKASREALRGAVALIYLDPPFFTGRTHERIVRERGPQTAPVKRTSRPAFDDRWENLTTYLNALRERLSLLRELLIPEGSVVVHVDPKTSHYVKVLGDEIFGMDNFASEIIWRYRRWPSKTRNFQRVHDVLLRWVRDADCAPRFTQLYEPLAPSTLKTWGQGKQRAVFDAHGRRRRSTTTKEKSPGVPMGDVWEIPIVAPVARERTGYPTQKPQALLRRIVESCSLPGDLVVDPYMGSGTTLAVATALGRAALGMDVGDEALAVTRQRLEDNGVPVDVTVVGDSPLESSGVREVVPKLQATGTLG